jgi:hypothetical protein
MKAENRMRSPVLLLFLAAVCSIALSDGPACAATIHTRGQCLWSVGGFCPIESVAATAIVGATIFGLRLLWTAIKCEFKADAVPPRAEVERLDEETKALIVLGLKNTIADLTRSANLPADEAQQKVVGRFREKLEQGNEPFDALLQIHDELVGR